MTEHKYTYEEIIKALECCLTVEVKGCGECPYRDENCINRIMTDALDLINRQRAEIESLKETACGKLTAGSAIFNWHEANQRRILHEGALQAEAIMKFAESIKTYYSHIDKTVGALINYTIDKKLEEFLGEGGVDDA